MHHQAASPIPNKPVIATADFAQLLGLLLEESSTLFGLKDLEHRYLYANRELENLYGVTQGKLIGHSVTTLLEASPATQIHQHEEAVVRTEQSQRFIENLKINNQEYTWDIIRFPYRNQHGKIIGTGFVAINISDHGNLDTDEKKLLVRAQQQISELQSAIEDMQQRASIDALTGALNRRRIEELAQTEMARHDRYGHPVSLVFADLDKFKEINDSWGHGTGDIVLKGFCNVLSQSLRSTDIFGRWGGEEFLLLLPNTGRSQAAFVAERVRSTLAAWTFPLPRKVTASFGVATRIEGEDLQAWIERADTALYRAKQHGRNRVEVDLTGSNGSNQPENIAPGFITLVWRSAYECGNSLIDQQHRKLFEDSNQLLTAVLAQQPKADIMMLIQGLLADIVQHFRDEEALISQAGFPDVEEHRQIHNTLVGQAIDLAKQFEEDQLKMGDLFSFLAYEVVARHMLAEDRKFFPYFSFSTA